MVVARVSRVWMASISMSIIRGMFARGVGMRAHAIVLVVIWLFVFSIVCVLNRSRVCIVSIWLCDRVLL